MNIPLDRSLSQPLYAQVAAFIRAQIERGALEPGMRLPSIRRLSQDLGVNRVTIETAYGELEADGLVTARGGSGTFVLPPFPACALPSLDGRAVPAAPPAVADRKRGTASSASDAATVELPRWQQALCDRRPDLSCDLMIPLQVPGPDEGPIALASGNSDARLFPLASFRRTLRTVLARDGIKALEYEDPAGYAPLRRTIARILADQGVPATPDTVLVTAGSQQALHLVAQVVLKPGDPVYVETPSYADGMALFRTLGLRIVPVFTDSEGMSAEGLREAIARHGHGLVFTMPNFQNPTGICMSGQRRRRIAAIAVAHGVPILEDDYVGDIRYEGYSQPSLHSLTPPGHTFYAGTFSKMLVPGLRMGYLVAEGPVLRMLARVKRMYDLSTSSVVQRTLERFVDLGSYRAHLTRACRIYKVRRDALLDSAVRHLPDDVTIAPVRGGLFAWLTLPEGVGATTLAHEAVRHGVTVTPGTPFFAEGLQGEQHLRINFTQHDPEILEEGMRRLARAIACCRKGKHCA